MQLPQRVSFNFGLISLHNMTNAPPTVPPKRNINEIDPADRDAVKRIHKQTFHAGATIDECLEAYLKHQDVDPAIESLKRQHERREAARFRERIEAAAAKSLYAAAGLPEPSSDDEQVKLTWYFADEMDLGEDEVKVGEFDSDVEDMITGGRNDMRQGKLLITPPPERSTVMNSFSDFTPLPTIARDVFGRVIRGFQVFQQPSDAEKTAATFKAHAILTAAFKQHPEEIMQRLSDLKFMTFGKSNPLNFRKVDHEFVDRFGHAPLKFTEAFPATTLDKTINGSTVKLKSATEEGTTKLRLMNVSASPLWSGKSGLHTKPDKRFRSLQLNTLSPEEIRLGDYYHHAFRPVAPHQFMRFPELPLHIQDLIWEFSFEPRVVEVQYDLKRTRIWSPTKWPPQSLACKESNAVMRRVYERSPFGDATARRGLLFNFNVDVLFLTYEKRIGNDWYGMSPLRVKRQLRAAELFLHSLPPAQLPKIRHLGLDLSIWRMLEYDMVHMRRRRHIVRGKDKFILPMLTGLMSLRVIQNDNLGCWRVNRRVGHEAVCRTTLVARKCSTEELGLNINDLQSVIDGLLVRRPTQSNDTRPPWWNGSAVTCMKMVDP